MREDNLYHMSGARVGLLGVPLSKNSAVILKSRETSALNKEAQRYTSNSYAGRSCARRRITVAQGASDFSMHQRHLEGLLGLPLEFVI